MKKKLLPLVGAMLLALTIGACTAHPEHDQFHRAHGG